MIISELIATKSIREYRDCNLIFARYKMVRSKIMILSDVKIKKKYNGARIIAKYPSLTLLFANHGVWLGLSRGSRTS